MEAPRSTDQLIIAIDGMQPSELVRILMHFDPWFIGLVGRPPSRVETLVIQAHARRIIGLRG